MDECQNGSITPRGRVIVAAAVVLAGVSVFVVGSSSATQAGGSADWSPPPNKEVTPGNETVCLPGNNTTVDNEPNSSGYQLRIVYENGWNGEVEIGDLRAPINGNGSETINLGSGDNEFASGYVTKNNRSDNETPLIVQLLLNGEIIDQGPVPPEGDSAYVNNLGAIDDTNRLNETATKKKCDPTEENTTSTNVTTNDSTFPAGVDQEGQVVLSDQNTTGTSVVVESATLPDSGFIVIHNESLMQGDIRGSMIGVSDKLDAERSEDIEVSLAREIEESQTLFAVLYRDSDDDGEFEYAGTDGSSDEFYLDDNGSPVADDADVSVLGTSGSETSENDSAAGTSNTDAQEADTLSDEGSTTVMPDATVNEGNEAFTKANAPGFGIGVAIIAMLGTALFATRRSL